MDRFSLAFGGSLLLCLATLLGGGWVAPSPESPDKHGLDLVRGQQLFTSRCAACHSTVAADVPRLGPNLHDVGRTAATRRPGLSAGAYLLESIVDPAAFIAPGHAGVMPPGMVADLEPADVRGLIAYLSSLGGHPDPAEIAALPIDSQAGGPADDSIALSRKEADYASMLIAQRCADCHDLSGNADFRSKAPAIFHVSLNEPARLEEVFASPPGGPRSSNSVDHSTLVGDLTAEQRQSLISVLRALN